MKKGFTLIELLVVVLIIGILSGIALPQYIVAVEKARASEALIHLRNLQNQLDLYILQNGLSQTGLNQEDLGLEMPGKKSSSSGAFEDKNFDYTVNCCSANATHVEIARLNLNYYYALKAERQENGRWTRYCYTETTDMGRKICKNLEGYGFIYMDHEF